MRFTQTLEKSPAMEKPQEVKYVLGHRGVTVHHPNGVNEFHRAGTPEYERLEREIRRYMPQGSRW